MCRIGSPLGAGAWGLRMAGKLTRSAQLLPTRSLQMARAREEIEPTPYEVIHSENKVRLRHYTASEPSHRIPVVIGYALVNNPSIYDLQPGRSIIGHFLERGFDVYLVDWGDPSLLDARLTVDDYVCRYLHNCVQAVREEAESETIHLMGYSTSVPLCVAYAALHPDTVATLLLQGPPVDFHLDAGMFQFNPHAEQLDDDRLTKSLGVVPAEFMDIGFAFRKPVEYTVTNPLRLYDNLHDREYVESQSRKLIWAADGFDMPGDLFREMIHRFIIENALVRETLVLCGRRVRLSSVRMPVLMIVGEHDQFVPESSVDEFIEKVSSTDVTVHRFPTGHVGLSTAPEAHEHGWPRVAEWLEERSEQQS